ncbi:hypothetical protein AB3S75_030847 [Citrus x aurantiifolia]
MRGEKKKKKTLVENRGSNGCFSQILEYIFLVGLLLVVNITTLARVNGAGECGNSSPDDEAMKLSSCATAPQDEKVPVSAGCRRNAQGIGQNPNCLCAVLQFDTAKLSGVKLQVAITIPKRCNITKLPADYVCGPCTIP